MELFRPEGLLTDPNIHLLSCLQEVVDDISQFNVEEKIHCINELDIFTSYERCYIFCKFIADYLDIRPKDGKLLLLIVEKYAKDHEKENMIISTIKKSKLFKTDIHEKDIFNSLIRVFPIGLCDIMMDDDVDSLQEIFTSPLNDINNIYEMGRISESLDIMEKFTAIQSSAFFSASKCFKYLFLNHAKLGLNKGITKYAIAGGSTEIIRILEQEGFSTTKDDIKYSIQYHHKEIFDWLVERNPNCFDENIHKLCIRHKFIHGMTYFELINPNIDFENACEVNFYEYSFYLVSNYDVNLRKPLKISCEKLYYFLITHIIKKCILDADDITCLINTACKSKFSAIVKPLLRLENANVNNVYDEELPLISSIKEDSYKIFTQLLNHRDINVNQQDINGNTALLVACKENRSDYVKNLLIIDGIDPNIENKISEFPLLEACRNGYVEIVDMLLDHPNIDVNKKSQKFGSYPLLVACTNMHYDIIRLLMEMEDLAPIEKHEFKYIESYLLHLDSGGANSVAIIEIIRENLIHS